MWYSKIPNRFDGILSTNFDSSNFSNNISLTCVTRRWAKGQISGLLLHGHLTVLTDAPGTWLWSKVSTKLTPSHQSEKYLSNCWGYTLVIYIPIFLEQFWRSKSQRFRLISHFCNEDFNFFDVLNPKGSPYSSPVVHMVKSLFIMSMFTEFF